MAYIEKEDCSECGKKDCLTVEFVAEENVGEYYAVNICIDCLNHWRDCLVEEMDKK